MPPSVSALDERSDAELISAVRAGNVAAYGELFARHVEAARRLGRQLVPGPDVDDLVSESFTKVLSVLQRGGGPDLAFRAYLLTAVRRVHVDRIRANARLHTTGDLTPFDPGVPFRDTAVEGFESAAAARAFGSLPERWQLVLWHMEVEGQKPAEVAPLLAMTPNAVSALAYRAREGLRQAYLSMHAADVTDDACRRTRGELGAYVRGGLSRRDASGLEQHLQGCRPCTALYLELTEVNSNLRALLVPSLLGTAASAYVASSGIGGTGIGIGVLLGRVRDVALSHGPTVAVAGAAAAAVVAGAVLTLHQDPEPDRNSIADSTPTVSAAPTPPPTSPSKSPTTTARRHPDRPVQREHRDGSPSVAATTGRTDVRAPAGPVRTPATSPAQQTAQQPSQQPSQEPTTSPRQPPAEPPSRPPLVDLAAQVTVVPDVVAVRVRLGLGGVTVVPDTAVGVPLPPVG